MAADLLNLIWSQFWQVTAVALLVSLASVLLRSRRWHPAVANWLWLLVLAKALTPPIWASPIGIFSWTNSQVVTSNSAGTMQSSSSFEAWTGVLVVALVAAWFVGFLATIVTHYSRWRELGALIELSRLPPMPALDARIATIARRLGLRKPPALIVTDLDLGPALVGIWRPKIILPQSLLKHTNWHEIEPIVAHELLHMRRYDTVISVLQLVANAIWWFHPLVRWAGKQVEEASERCVDLAVMHVAGCDASSYCRSLLRVLEIRSEEDPCLLIAAPGVRGVSATYERISELAEVQPRPGFWQRSSGLAFACFLGLLLLPGRQLDVLQPRCCATELLQKSVGGNDVTTGVDQVRVSRDI